MQLSEGISGELAAAELTSRETAFSKRPRLNGLDASRVHLLSFYTLTQGGYFANAQQNPAKMPEPSGLLSLQVY